MKFSKDFKEIKGDASIRKFYRNTKKNSIIVFANIEKIKNLLIYDSINKILIKNNIIAPKLLSQNYRNNYIEIQDLGNKTIYQIFTKNKKNFYLILKKVINVLNKIQRIKDKNFMLLCGFEKFENFYVRIDILERLFVLIINSGTKENTEIKIVPEMLNLLGCSKDNFKKLLQKMNYRIFEKKEETYFKYNPIKKFKKSFSKKISNENPFKILKNLNLN